MITMDNPHTCRYCRRNEVDAVEVVRCKDCDSFSPNPFGAIGIGWCKTLCDHCRPDFFCANGKKRTEKEG